MQFQIQFRVVDIFPIFKTLIDVSSLPHHFYLVCARMILQKPGEKRRSPSSFSFSERIGFIGKWVLRGKTKVDSHSFPSELVDIVSLCTFFLFPAKTARKTPLNSSGNPISPICIFNFYSGSLFSGGKKATKSRKGKRKQGF